MFKTPNHLFNPVVLWALLCGLALCGSASLINNKGLDPVAAVEWPASPAIVGAWKGQQTR